MKKTHSNKLFQRARQRAKLIIARPDFQENISSLRKKFNIPADGLKGERKIQKWHHEFYQSDDDYHETVWRSRRHEIIRLKKERKFREAEELSRDLNNTSPVNAFRITIKNLLRKYKIPLRWNDSIRRYTLFNDINNMWLPGGLLIQERMDEDNGLMRLYIEIDDDTTLEDIKQGWQRVKYHQKKLHSRTRDKFQPIKEFERDKKAYELDRQGKSLKEIVKTLFNESGETYEWTEASKFIERHRKKIGIN